jgi:solute carrier family 34 (sodium-dependent phosphate cotransporter)
MEETRTSFVADPRRAEAPAQRGAAFRLLEVAVLLFVFLSGIRGLSIGFAGLGQGLLQSFFTATESPFVGLLVGMLATTLLQSSSVTTSMVVALVAAPDDPLPIQNAIPMIMGANIGTTVTNTLVSLGHVGRPDELKRALAAATCHDFFNLMAVAILLPLELVTGVLTRASAAIAGVLHGLGQAVPLSNPVGAATHGVITTLQAALATLLTGPGAKAAALVAVSAAVIFVALYVIVARLRGVVTGKLGAAIGRSLGGRNGYRAILIGAALTMMVQSSSITTSLLVPLAAAGLITLEQAFPVTLGANLGTTITAMLAATAVSPASARIALQIAAVHLLFNGLGIAMIYPSPRIRALPLRAARAFAAVATANKKVALAYLLLVFYGVPALCIGLARVFAG